VYGGYTPCPYNRDEVQVQKVDESLTSFLFSLTADTNYKSNIDKISSKVQNKDFSFFNSNNENYLICFGQP